MPTDTRNISALQSAQGVSPTTAKTPPSADQISAAIAEYLSEKLGLDPKQLVRYEQSIASAAHQAVTSADSQALTEKIEMAKAGRFEFDTEVLVSGFNFRKTIERQSLKTAELILATIDSGKTVAVRFGKGDVKAEFASRAALRHWLERNTRP